MKKSIQIIILIVLGLSLKHADAIEIVDGWTWKYKDINYEGEYCYWFEYGFDGTEEINGKTYHVFRNTAAEKKMRWDDGVWFDDDILLSQPWYVREEDNKFYVLFNRENEKFNYDWDTYMQCTPPSKEIMLYDFNASPGESFICGEGEKYTMKATVIGEINHKVGNSELKCQEIEYSLIPHDPADYPYSLKRIISQDYGVVERGFLTFFTLGGTPGSYRIEYGPQVDHNNLELYSIVDEKGNEIYNPEYISSSPDLINDSIHECNKTFDLYGREVKTVLPGSVYIRNGKKFIGR
ncbi:MAG: hypothetical protein K2H18_07570 [Muribaculaceae bacterium]|nr:hypothetical protein [Muribaculaceae bacterium]